MRKYLGLLLVLVLLLAVSACGGAETQTEVVQNGSTDGAGAEDYTGGQATSGDVEPQAPETEASVIEPITGISPADLMPQAEELPHAYSPEFSGEIANEGLNENWGEEVAAAVSESGRVTGAVLFATLAEEGAEAPVELFIVIEQFQTIEGAALFFNFDFMPDFRNGIFEGQPYDLEGADQAIFQTILQPAKFGEGYLMHSIAFLYRNFTVHIDAPGPADGFPKEYAVDVAKIILGHLIQAAE